MWVSVDGVFFAVTAFEPLTRMSTTCLGSFFARHIIVGLAVCRDGVLVCLGFMLYFLWLRWVNDAYKSSPVNFRVRPNVRRRC